MSDDEFRQMLAVVSAEYRAGLPARIAGIEELWDQVMRGGGAAQTMNDLILALHSIAGSAETFGLTAVGRVAAAAESCLEPYRDVQPMPDVTRAEVTRLLETLRLAAGADASR